MIPKERRRHFLINKPLQFRYMLTISAILLIVIFVSLANLYFGIWSEVVNAFSDTQIQNDLLTAARLQQYEEARVSPLAPPEESSTSPSLFRQVERLSDRQLEIFKTILDQTNRALLAKLLPLLILITVGTIFLSHKIAGPLFRFQKIFESLGRGDMTVRCQLRKFDEAKPVAESLNQALVFLDSALLRLKKIVYEDGDERSEQLSRLKEELEKFKTGSGH